MGTRNTRVGTSRFNEHDNQKTTIHEIRRVKSAVNALSAGGGGSATFAEQQAQTALLTSIDTKSNLQILRTEANDLVEDYTYLDAGNIIDRRIDTIVYSSVLLTLTVTETFTYAGVVGDYYVIQSALS